jgi:hypothetical protein
MPDNFETIAGQLERDLAHAVRELVQYNGTLRDVEQLRAHFEKQAIEDGNGDLKVPE